MCKHQGHNPSGFSFSLALHFFTPLGGEDSPLFARAAQSDAQLGMREPLRLPVTKHFCATWVFSELPYFFVKYKNTTSNTNNAHQEGSYDPATQCGQDLCNTKHQAFMNSENSQDVDPLSAQQDVVYLFLSVSLVLLVLGLHTKTISPRPFTGRLPTTMSSGRRSHGSSRHPGRSLQPSRSRCSPRWRRWVDVPGLSVRRGGRGDWWKNPAVFSFLEGGLRITIHDHPIPAPSNGSPIDTF